MIKPGRFGFGFLAGVLVSGLGLWGYHAWHTTAEEARTLYCMAVLKQVGWAFRDYQDRHAGSFPMQLGELDDRWLGTFSFRCPSVKHLGQRAYLYVPPGKGASGETPILFCWHHPELVLLTCSGEVRRLKPSEGFEREPPGSNLPAVLAEYHTRLRQAKERSPRRSTER